MQRCKDMDQLSLEIWLCGNKEEWHVFVTDKPNEYIIGFNPEYIDPITIINQLLEIGFKLDQLPEKFRKIYSNKRLGL